MANKPMEDRSVDSVDFTVSEYKAHFRKLQAEVKRLRVACESANTLLHSIYYSSGYTPKEIEDVRYKLITALVAKKALGREVSK